MREMFPLRPGDRVTWTSKAGRTVTLQRTDAGQTWTVARRTRNGVLVGDLATFGNEAAARDAARFLAEAVRGLESEDAL